MPEHACEFYNNLAADYDAMTDFSARLNSAVAFAGACRARTNYATVLDVATGTGVYALAFAKTGATVIGTDLAPSMLEQARQHAQAHSLAIEWLAADMTRIDHTLNRQFDLVVCMGNSLPHILNRTDLDQTIAGFSRLVNPGGSVAVQVLNYEQIQRENQRIVEINRMQNLEFIRFYDFTSPHLNFNILTIDWANATAQHHLQSVPLYPWRQSDLQQTMHRAGLQDITAYGSPALEPFVAEQSPTLLMFGKRPL